MNRFGYLEVYIYRTFVVHFPWVHPTDVVRDTSPHEEGGLGYRRLWSYVVRLVARRYTYRIMCLMVGRFRSHVYRSWTVFHSRLWSSAACIIDCRYCGYKYSEYNHHMYNHGEHYYYDDVKATRRVRTAGVKVTSLESVES